MKFQKANFFTAGDGKLGVSERVISDISFKVHKFSVRSKPKDRRNIVIFPIFSEFGCETLASIYCIPRLLREQCSGKYTIVIGWHGREYFYRHLVDEFWELPEEHMWLREYSRAFHHVSRNLRMVEKNAVKIGNVIDIMNIGNVAVFPVLTECPHCKGVVARVVKGQKCQKCNHLFPVPGLFTDVKSFKREAKWLPAPSIDVTGMLPKNAVGITARHRKTWGRNLEPIFYERLIFLLEDMGYNPVWLGEKATSLPCPFRRIKDYSGAGLELVLSLVSRMKFTVQFWTASSRLAALVGTPYLLFESPDQIWGAGQEGLRLNLLTRGDKKLVISHYRNVCEDNTAGLALVKRAVREMERGDYADIIGMVENQEYMQFFKKANDERIGCGHS